MKDKSKFRFGMFLVTIGIVYGDIGTSPMYVMKSILEGNGGITQINEAFIIGSLSLVIWTITLLTTVKYVLIAMKADNHGEGGIFSLFSLVRGCGKWLIVPAMLGGAALLADGVLTPAVTVTTAVEGLRSMEVMNRFLGTGQVKVVVITLIIITALCDQFDPILPGDPIPFYRFSYQMDASAGGFRSRCTFDRVFQSDLPPAPVRPVPPSAPAAAAPEPATAKEDPA